MNARMIFVAVLGLLLICSSTLSAYLNEGLISHWQFDEGSGTTAYDSAGTNDGTIHEATWTTGKIDGALNFDGSNDYVDVGNDSSLMTTGDLTICAWIKARKTRACIYSHSWTGWGLGFGIGNNNYDGRLGFYTWTHRHWIEAGGSLADDTWHHVAVTLEGTMVRLYSDGIEIGNESGTPASNLTGIGLIGLYNYAWHFGGIIDDLMIYSSALSAEEIWQLYKGEVPNVVGLEVVGPDEVAENFSAGYKAIAYYDDDSTKDVTDLALWAVEPEATASIEAGVLTTKDIISDQVATILASYTEGEVTFEAEKMVDIFAICPTGTALSFDGVDDYVDCGNDDSLNMTTAMTISAWIMTSHTSTTQGIIAKGARPNTNYAMDIIKMAQGGALRFFGYESGTPKGIIEMTGATIADGTWHHLAGTFDGTQWVIYDNGQEYQNKQQPATLTATTESLYIGQREEFFYFNGRIDEVRIYNRALSAEEIWASTHTRFAGDEPGLVGYWDLDEGEGQIVYDLSGNGNDGQLGSTPDVDESDPAWVESDAPIGYCTPYLIAIGAAKEALKHKRASLKELEAALAKEWTMYDALEQWLESGDFADLSKGDIVKARQKTHSAMQHEEQSIDVLEKGFEKLLDSLVALGYGPQPPGSNWPPNVTIIKPQNGTEFNPDQKIEIKADAWDYDGSVVSVKFFAGGSKIGEDNDGADGWTTIWYDHPEGSYNLTAEATDDYGAATTSATVGIRVVEEPPPPPPPPPRPPPPP